MRDSHNDVMVVASIYSIILNNDTEGTGLVVDGQGYDAVEHVINVGISADTLSGSVKLDLKIEHGDLADGTDMAGVTDQHHLLGVSADLTAGLFATIDDAGEDPAIHKIGYRGPKRYTRIFVDTTGTHTNGTPLGAVALLSRATKLKVA